MFLSFFSFHHEIMDFFKTENCSLAAVESNLLTVIFSVGSVSLFFLLKGFERVLLLDHLPSQQSRSAFELGQLEMNILHF